MSNDSVIDEHFAFVSAEYSAGFQIRLMIDNGVRGVAALKSLNRELDKPFGDVPIASRALAFALAQVGFPMEWRREDCPGDWRLGNPAWMPELCYRVLPKPEEFVLPSIDWSHVAPKWKWLAQDRSGDGYLTTARPRADGEEWLDGCDYAEARGFASFAPGKGDWTQLIVERPA